MSAYMEAVMQTEAEGIMEHIASECGREAVTFRWFYENMSPDACLWLYNHFDELDGLDPWKEITDYDVLRDGSKWLCHDKEMEWSDIVYIQTKDK